MLLLVLAGCGLEEIKDVPGEVGDTGVGITRELPSADVDSEGREPEPKDSDGAVAGEDCANALDDDEDGWIDCADSDCASEARCMQPPTPTCVGEPLDHVAYHSASTPTTTPSTPTPAS